MGCDIHFHIEVKTKNGWELYSKPNVKRNYKLFAKLAGVRNYDNIKPISEPKGLPEDISYLVKQSFESWGTDAHSASYITGEEIIKLDSWLEESKPYSEDTICMANSLEYGVLHCYLEGNSFSGFYQYPKDRPSYILDVRFVFWFDN